VQVARLHNCWGFLNRGVIDNAAGDGHEALVEHLDLIVPSQV